MHVFKKTVVTPGGYQSFYLWRQRSYQPSASVHFLDPHTEDKYLVHLSRTIFFFFSMR